MEIPGAEGYEKPKEEPQPGCKLAFLEGGKGSANYRGPRLWPQSNR